MGKTSRRRWALAAASIAAAVWACDGGEPPVASAPSDEPPAIESTDPPAVSEPPPSEDAVVIPSFDPSRPTLELEPPAIPAAQPPEVPAAKPKVPARRSVGRPATTAAKADPEHPPLDALFRAGYVPPGERTTLDLAPAAPDKPAPRPPGSLDRLGDSIRLERRGEAIGPAGPRQGTAWETEAGVRIPVDKSISLEGGVRVESREEPGVKHKEEARRTPKVGVEVRF